MTIRQPYTPELLCALLVFALCGVARGGQGSGVSIPSDTKLDTIQDSDGKVVNLKPAEQVAFLFVYAIKDLERTCGSTFFGGPGRPCTMVELIQGLKTKTGQPIALSQNPTQDTNYRYTLTIIGKDCVVTAIPKTTGLGAFAWVGTAGGRGNGNFYYNPDGTDLTKAEALGAMGYQGKGFKQ